MFASRFTGFLALALGLAALARAEAPRGPTIEVWPPTPDAGTAIRIKVEGEWPDACTPRLSGARVDGIDIVLSADLPSRNCVGEARRYSTGSEKLGTGSLSLPGNGTYRIRYEIRRAPGAEPELHGFRLLYVGNNPEPGFVPETGFWWPEHGGEFDGAGPGLGAQIEVQDKTLSISVFGYDTDGRASWFLGAGAMNGYVTELELSQLNDGAGPFDPYRAPANIAPVGTLHLQLLSPSRATLWFVRPDGNGRGLQTQPVSMVRFRFAQEPAEAWLGRWVVLAERDDGYPTQRIDFVTVQRDEQGFALGDASGEYRLRCEHAVDKPNSPPARCRLGTRSGATLEVDFDHVALNELRGWTGAGQRIVALKLNR